MYATVQWFQPLAEAVQPVDALLSMLAGFALILVLTRLRVPISAAVIVGAVVVSTLFGNGAARTGQVLLEGLFRLDMLLLAIIIVVVIVLTQLMRETGRLEEIVASLRLLLRRPAVSMAALPAMLGLLPMPGGALFSAPLVASAAGGTNVERARLSAINFWFRHVWEYWWPLYPGVILAMSLTRQEAGIGDLTFLQFQVPLSIPMILAGMLLFIGSHRDLHISAPRAPAGTKRRLLRATAPIWLIILIYAAGQAVLAWLDWAGVDLSAGLASGLRMAPIAIGLAVSLIWSIATSGLPPWKTARLFAAGSIYKMVLVVMMVMVYKHVVESIDAGRLMGEELAALYVPTAVVVAVLPFIAGVVLGVAVGFVGASFPIILPLVAGRADVSAYIALAYAFGHMGQMLSPIHICYIVSNDYFQTPGRPVFLRILPVAMLTMAGVVGYFLLLRWVL